MRKLTLNNKGKITIFAMLIIGVLIILLATVYDVMMLYMAKSKSVVASNLAVTNLKGQYIQELFQQYHILSLDINCGDEGIGAYEEEMIHQLEATLGVDKNAPIVNDFTVKEIVITPKQYLMDNNCQALKDQIQQEVFYMGIEDVSSLAIDAIDSEKYKVSESQWNQIDADTKDGNEGLDDTQNGNVESGNISSNEIGQGEGNNNSDPRDDLDEILNVGILDIVKPVNLDINYDTKNLEGLPSASYTSSFLNFDIDTDFDSYTKMKSEVKDCGTWDEKLINKGASTYYAMNVFKYLGSQDIEEDTVFDFEVEYLICGKDNDFDNLDGVVNRIIVIRMPINFAYLVSDTEKMSRLDAISVSIATFTCIPPSITKYLLAGCWSYAESLADLRVLLGGKKQEFIKSRGNWITDIDNLGKSIDDENSDSEVGIGYEDYLMILLACTNDEVYYRMLDLMELNIKQTDSTFEIKNCVISYIVDVTIEYKGELFQTSYEAQY